MPKKNISELTPNEETIAALKEADNGCGETFHGTSEELIEKLLSEEDSVTVVAGQGVGK